MEEKKCANPGCDQPVDWNYMPGDHGYCDEHVPRGCGCTNFEEEPRSPYLDRKGRMSPCVEYDDLIAQRQEDVVAALAERVENVPKAVIVLSPDEAALLLEAIRERDHVITYLRHEVMALENFIGFEDDEEPVDDDIEDQLN